MADKPKKLNTLFCVAATGALAAVTISVAHNVQRDYAEAKADYAVAKTCMEKTATGDTCTEAETAALDKSREREKRDARHWVFLRKSI